MLRPENIARSSSLLFSADVPGEPVPQGRPRVRTRPPGVYYSKRSAAYRDMLVYYFRAAKKGRKPVCRPCYVGIAVAGLAADGDLDNVTKQVLDALVTAGVIANDSSAIVHAISAWISTRSNDGIGVHVLELPALGGGGVDGNGRP